MPGAVNDTHAGLHFYLDHKPYDWKARLRLARTLRDAGRVDEARYYVFTVRKRLHPMSPADEVYDEVYAAWELLGWTWWRDQSRRPWDLGEPYFLAVYGTNESDKLWTGKFRTRREAEEAFRRALEANDYGWRH